MLTVVATVVLVLGGSLASCSDGGGDQAAAAASGSRTAAAAGASTPAPTASASVAPSLSAEYQALKDAALAMEEPVPPEGMNENSVEGATLSAAYFIDLFPYVYATGDLTDWETMSEEGCVFCNNVIEDVTTRNAEGWWSDPWEQKVTIMSRREVVDDPTTFLIDVNISSGEIISHRGDGTIARHRPAQDTEPFTFQMHWNGAGWSVAEGAVT